MKYTHSQRNYAHVCADQQVFSGTVGAENCSVDEIAALLMLLEHDLAGHGFKIGLGKPLGLGSMTSTITRVYIRNCADYAWQEPVKVSPSTLLAALNGKIGGLDELNKAMASLRAVQMAHNALNSTEKMAGRKLRQPPPGSSYWTQFKKKSSSV